MNRTLAPLAALLLSAAILLMGNGLQGTLLPLRAEFEAFRGIDIGIMGSAYFIGFGTGCVLGPHAVARVGHIRAFTALAAVASAVPIAHLLVLQPWSWWLFRAATGFCLAGLYVVIESWLAERSTPKTRGLTMSVYTIINLTVIVAGQMMITLYDPRQFALFGLASILVSLAAVPVALTAAPAPAPVARVRLRLGRLWRTSPVAVVGCIGVGLTNGSFWSVGPLFAQRIGLTVAGVALFMSLTVIGGALGQWPLGRASDRTDRRHVMIGACLAAALAGIGMVVVDGERLSLALSCALLFGMFSLPLYAICVAHAYDFAAPNEFVETSSGLLLVYSFGAVTGPALAALLMDRVGPEGLYMLTAAVHAGMAGFAAFRMRRRRARSEDARPGFVSTAATTPVATGLDPRAEAEGSGRAEGA